MQAVYDANEVVHFAPRQCGRRLIHDDQTGIGSDRASNGDELARCDGEFFDGGRQKSGFRRQSDVLQGTDGRLPQALEVETPREAAVRGNQLLRQRDVLLDAQIGKKRQVLINRLDAGCQAPIGVSPSTFLPLIASSPPSAGWAPEMILMSVLLPHPFSPMRCRYGRARS